MRLLATIIAGFALLALPASAAAAPGALDGSFGSGGVTSLATGTELFGVALQSDGEIVATGDAGGSLLVERFSAGGAPEAAFGGGAGIARGVAIQPDGKIVVAGYDSAGMLVERFNTNGTLDSSFGSGGVVHAVPNGRANGVALGPGGTIIAAGQRTGPDGFQHVEILRLTASGSPDTSFAGSGSELALAGNKDAIAKAVAVQADGGIVMAGSIGPGTSQAIVGFVMRVSANGVLDSSFAGGLVIFPPVGGGAAATLNAVALDPAGGIVAGGGATTSNQSEAVFERLTCSGAPSGLQVTPSSTGFDIDPVGANAVTVAGGRHLVGAGEFRDSGLNSAALWGFELSGAGDFATVAPSGADANGIGVDAQGNFVVAGSNVPAGLAPSGFVARYVGFGTPASGSSPCGGTSTPPPPPQTPPTVTTGSPSAVTSSSATLSGSVNPNGQTTSYHFQYGPSTAYGSQTGAASAGAGSTTVSVSAAISGLAHGTTYHYRLVATNPAGTTYGSDATFRTTGTPPPAPVISKLSQSNRTWGETKSTTRKRKVGTTFSFTLSEDATVQLVFTQQVSGRRVAGKCVAPSRQNQSKSSCRRTVTLGTLSFPGRRGTDKLAFNGGISRRNTLKAGTYTVTFTATSSAGKRSRSQSLTFTIVM